MRFLIPDLKPEEAKWATTEAAGQRFRHNGEFLGGGGRQQLNGLHKVVMVHGPQNVAVHQHERMESAGPDWQT